MQVRGEAVDDRVDVAQVRGAGTGLLRGADADEVDVAELCGLGERRAEPEAAGLDGAGEHLVEARLEERGPAGAQQLDLARVDVDAEDLVPEVGHAGRVNCSEVSGSEDGQTHARLHLTTRPGLRAATLLATTT